MEQYNKLLYKCYPQNKIKYLYIIYKMAAINVENSVVSLAEKIKIKLCKSYTTGASGTINYFFILCGPQIIKISNCSDYASITIPKCFEIDGHFFELNTTILQTYAYTNMTNGQCDTQLLLENKNLVLFFNTSGITECHNICLDELTLHVTPKYIPCNKTFNGCIGTLASVCSIVTESC